MSLHVWDSWIAPQAYFTHIPHLNLQTSTHPVYSICIKSWSGVPINDHRCASTKHITESWPRFEHLPSESCYLPQVLRTRQHPLPLQLHHLPNSNKPHFTLTLLMSKHDSAYPCTSVLTSLQLKTQKVEPVLNTYHSNLVTSHKSAGASIPAPSPAATAKQQCKPHHIDSSNVQAWVDLSVVE